MDADGVRFMTGQHELGELAPRDIVAKAITRRMREQGTTHMYLDARHFGADMWENRFPTILAACRAHGIDPVTAPVPVSPAAHYASGGVRTDTEGRTTVPGLYACGEVACTGVHGANRLASNSLLEGLVYAERIAAHLVTRHRAAAERSPAASAPDGQAATDASEPVREPVRDRVRTEVLQYAEDRFAVQRAMSEGAGVLRSAASLRAAAEALDALRARSLAAAGRDGASAPGDARPAEPGVETWQATNLLTVARVLTEAALAREETRGCHWREDHPERDDPDGARHIVVTLDAATHTPRLRPTSGTTFPPTRPHD
ncbi:L-aspartate oxidase [Streptomyces sp. SPB074]|nr:L-aspartate oxidase [Streptomyces sp. SPB074]